MLVDKDRPVKKKVFGEDNIVELVQTYTESAKSYTAAGKYTDALASWQKVLKLKPDSKEAKQAIADLNKKMIPPTKKEAKPVKKEEKPEKKLTREEIEKLFEKGTIYFIAERYDKALALFNQVLKHDPKHTGARDYKKRTEVRMKLFEE
jgi:tetratricopeptide (TPR) repeat protein